MLRLGWVTAIDILRQGATVVFILVLIAVGAGLLPLLGVTIPVALVVLAATIPLVRGAVPPMPSYDREEWRRLLRITLPFAAATGIGVIYAYLTIVLMSLVSTQHETGLFGAAFRVFVVLTQVPGLLVVSAFPVLSRAARDDRTRLAYALQRLFDISVILGAGLALATIVGAAVAIDVVAGSKFHDSIGVLQIQGLAYVGTALAALWGFTLLSVRAHRALLVTNGIALATSMALTLALAPSHGAKGAAVANVAGESVLAAAYAVALMRSHPDLRVGWACCRASGSRCSSRPPSR